VFLGFGHRFWEIVCTLEWGAPVDEFLWFCAPSWNSSNDPILRGISQNTEHKVSMPQGNQEWKIIVRRFLTAFPRNAGKGTHQQHHILWWGLATANLSPPLRPRTTISRCQPRCSCRTVPKTVVGAPKVESSLGRGESLGEACNR
jgi:hypothetical protein